MRGSVLIIVVALLALIAFILASAIAKKKIVAAAVSSVKEVQNDTTVALDKQVTEIHKGKFGPVLQSDTQVDLTPEPYKPGLVTFFQLDPGDA